MIEEEGRREKRKSDQLQESMTSLRMVIVISSTLMVAADLKIFMNLR